MTTKITTYYSPKALGSSCFLFPRTYMKYYNNLEELYDIGKQYIGPRGTLFCAANEYLSARAEIDENDKEAQKKAIEVFEKYSPTKYMKKETVEAYEILSELSKEFISATTVKARKDVIKEMTKHLKAMDQKTLDPYDGTLRHLHQAAISAKTVKAREDVIKKMIKHLKAMDEEASKEILVGKAAISATLKAHEDDIIKAIKHYGTTCKDFFKFPPVIDAPEDMIEVTVELSGCPEENSIEDEL